MSKLRLRLRLLSVFMAMIFVVASISGGTRLNAAGTSMTRDDFQNSSAGNWAEDYIMYCYDRGFLDFPSNANFSPDMDIKRSCFASMVDCWTARNSALLQTLGFRYIENNEVLYDISPENYLYKRILSVTKKGIMKGVSGRFSPNASITNEEAAGVWYTLLSSLKSSNLTEEYIKELNADNVLSKFSDYESISPEYKTAVAVMIDFELMAGYADNKIRPGRNMSFAEACIMLYNAELNLVKYVQEKYPEINWNYAGNEAALPSPTANIMAIATATPNPDAEQTKSPEPTASYEPGHYISLKSMTLDEEDETSFKVYFTIDFDSFVDELYFTVAHIDKPISVSNTDIDNEELLPLTTTFMLGEMQLEESYAYRRIYSVIINTELSGYIYVYGVLHSEGERSAVKGESIYLTPQATPSPSPTPTPIPIPIPTPEPTESEEPTATPTPTPKPTESEEPTTTPTPTAPVGSGKAVSVSASSNNHFALAITESGDLYGWGVNDKGQINSSSLSAIPEPVKIMGGVKEVYAGDIMDKPISFAIVEANEKRSLYAWGSGLTLSPISTTDGSVTGFSYVGNYAIASTDSMVYVCNISSISGSAPVFTAVMSLNRDAEKVVNNGNNFAVIDHTGTLYIWGTCAGTDSPEMVQADSVSVDEYDNPIPYRFMDVAIGYDTIVAIGEDGQLWGMGDSILDESDKQVNVFSKINVIEQDTVSGEDIIRRFISVSISTGIFTSIYAVDENGFIWAWGDNRYGQLGYSVKYSSKHPAKLINANLVGLDKEGCFITPSYSTASSFAAVNSANGNARNLYAWGWNKYGQLSYPDESYKGVNEVPVFVIGGIRDVFAFGATTYFIKDDGTLWESGNAYYGLLNPEDIDRSYVYTCKQVIIKAE